jgi:signal transduction histidine kinase
MLFSCPSERHVEICLVRDAGGFVLSVTDDGRGFEEQLAANLGGMGLAEMRERARLAGGTFEIRSRPGCTEVMAPFERPERPP